MPLATNRPRGSSAKTSAARAAIAPRKTPPPAPPLPQSEPTATSTANVQLEKAPVDNGAPSPTDTKPEQHAVGVSSNGGLTAGKITGGEDETNLVHIGLHEPRARQQHHISMLDSMDRKARELCDDTRRQYELLLARLEAQHERQLQALQHQLKELVASSVPLSEHREALREQARAHERDTRALVRVHDEEAAALRVRCKQIAAEQQLRRSRAFQDEKDQLMETMAQLEMDRNAALRQWREEELTVLAVQKELEEERHAHTNTQHKLREAGEHLVAQLPKLDRLATKVKDERAAHAAALTHWTKRQEEANEAIHELKKRLGIVETELAHARAAGTAQQDELSRLQGALASRETQVSELQRALAESAAKETLLREFRESERAAFEQQRDAWRDTQTRLERQDGDARQQIAALQLEKQALAAQSERLAQDAARAASDGAQHVAALRDKLRALRAKHDAVAQRAAQLEAALAERREEERVDELLFSGGGSRGRR